MTAKNGKTDEESKPSIQMNLEMNKVVIKIELDPATFLFVRQKADLENREISSIINEILVDKAIDIFRSTKQEYIYVKECNKPSVVPSIGPYYSDPVSPYINPGWSTNICGSPTTTTTNGSGRVD